MPVTKSAGQRVVGLLVVSLAISATVLNADELAVESFEHRLATLEANYADLSSDVSRLPPTTCVSPCHCADPPAGGVIGGAAVVFAQPFLSGNSPFDETIFSNNVFYRSANAFQYDFQATPRVWIGYQGQNGHGIRARYWTFNGSAGRTSFTDPENGPPNMVRAQAGLVGSELSTSVTSASNTFFIAVQSLGLDVIDLEYTRKVDRSWGDIYFSGGVRYAAFDQSMMITNNFAGATIQSHFDLEGVGPMIGTELVVPATETIQFYGAGRAGVLLSSFDQHIELYTGPLLLDVLTTDDRNHVVGSFEAQLGLRFALPLACGATLFAQGAAEGQLWTEMAQSRDDLTNLGFLGLSAAFGVTR